VVSRECITASPEIEISTLSAYVVTLGVRTVYLI
jgi:hypothetical protein